jgi:type IV pilus assembly protein PilM
MSFIDQIFKKNSQSVLGIDIGSSSIKVVQLRKKGPQAILETYGELSLGPYGGVSIGQATSLSPEKIAEALGDILKEKEVNITTNSCGIAIPFSSSLMSLMQVPDVPRKELESMVPLEARKYIPVPISEVTIDWSVIPREQNKPDVEEEDVLTSQKDPQEKKDLVKPVKTIDVLLVAIHNDTLTRYSDIVTKNNLQASFFEIEIFSTMRAVLDQEIDPVMIFDMGAASTKLYIIERGTMRASHTINRGSQNITAALAKSLGVSDDQAEIMKREFGLSTEGANAQDVAKVVGLTLDYVFSEANQVLLNFQKKYGKNVSKVFLVGGGSALKGLHPIAQKNLQTEVISGNPFAKVVTPVFLEQILKETGPQFTVALGVALRKLQELE